MKEQIQDRRQTRRVLFSMEDQIMGRITIPDLENTSVVVQILNMSIDGICFFIRSTRDIHLKSGDEIVLVDIRKQDSAPLPLKVKNRIIWIQENPDNSYTGVGSKFMDAGTEELDSLENFISSFR